MRYNYVDINLCYVYTAYVAIVLNLPATVSLVVLPSSPPLHVTSTVLVKVTVSFDVSVTGEVDSSTLHRTVVYETEYVVSPVTENIVYAAITTS